MWSWCCPEKEPTSQKPLGTQFDSTNYMRGKPCARDRNSKVSQTQIVPHQAHNLICTNRQRDNFRTTLCVLLSVHQTLHSTSMCLVLPLAWPWEDRWVLSAECLLQHACASGCVCVIYDPWPCRLQNVYTRKWPVIRASHVMCFIVCSWICIFK